MKASYCTKYGGPEVYQIKDIDTPTINENQVLVKVYRAIVSPTDSNFRSGSPFIARLFSGLIRPKKKVHGEMFAGEITDVGTNVTNFKVGELVYGSNGMNLGAYAEYISVDQKEAIKKIPSNISYKDALTLLDGGITALPFLKELGKVKKGDKVLINGASGAVGSMAVMIANHLGAEVTGVCGPNNVETVKSLGPSYVINYKEKDFTKENIKYDIIFDAVGKSNYSLAKNALTEKGLFMTTVPTPGVMLQTLFKLNKDKKRSRFMAAGLRKPQTKIEDLTYLENLLLSKELSPLHGKEYPLHELGKAQSYVETGHKVGNVAIQIV